MLNNQGQAVEQQQLLASDDASNTAAATSSWVAVGAYEGDLMFNVNTGTVTAGNIVWTIEDADDGSGTNNAGVTPNEGAFTTVTTANDPLSEKRTINASAVRPYIRIVGTITTGPVQCSADLLSHPKYTT